MTETLIRPMLATAAALPTSPGWAYEFKWDGVRAITYVDGRGVHVMSRNDRDITATYPEVEALAETAAGRSLVLDGELVAFDTRGRPDFGLLQNRMHVGHPSPDLLRQVRVSYLIFDLLRLERRTLFRVPQQQRRDELEGLGLAVPGAIDIPPSFSDVEGVDVLEAAEQQGLEGVVSKRMASIYQPGRRSSDWIKVALVKAQEVVIGGWQPGQGRRSGMIGSLLLGVTSDEGLQYVGHVGTGFTGSALEQLGAILNPLARQSSPFANEVPPALAKAAQWVEPRVVGEVEFRQWTHEGRLRHSSWRGLRPDKSPDEVRQA